MAARGCWSSWSDASRMCTGMPCLASMSDKRSPDGPAPTTRTCHEKLALFYRHGAQKSALLSYTDVPLRLLPSLLVAYLRDEGIGERGTKTGSFRWPPASIYRY